MNALDAGGVTGIVWRRVDPAHEPEAEEIMRELMTLARGHAGYLGSEVFPPVPGVQDAYVVLYRYSSTEQLRKWLGSEERAALLRKLAAYLLEPCREFYVAHRGRVPGTASTVLAYHIKQGHEAEFHEWRGRILEESRKWPGFLGAEAFDVLDSGSHPELVIVLRYDSKAHLDGWLESDVRASYLREVRPLIHEYRVRRTGTGFEGWFDISKNDSPPAAWRQGVLILAALFPIIMALRTLLDPLFHLVSLPVAMLILVVVDVAVLTFVVMPRFSRAMAWWLKPKLNATWRTESAGLGIILAILGATLAAALLV